VTLLMVEGRGLDLAKWSNAMLTYSLDVTAARLAECDERASPLNDPRPRQRTRLLWNDGGRVHDLPSKRRSRQLSDREYGKATGHELEITPAHAVTRRAIGWDGISVEIVQCVTQDKVEFCFRALPTSPTSGPAKVGSTWRP
jgi:AraC family transcriptional regulator